jgi:chromosome segregation protein
MGDERLELLRELEREDQAAVAKLEELDALYAAVEELSQRALELQATLERLPEEWKAASEAVEDADRALADRRVAAEQAAEAFAAAEAGEDQEWLAEARRFYVRAQDSLHMAERRAATAHERLAELESRASAAEREIAALEARVQQLAAQLVARPGLTDDAVAEPGPGAAGIADWGTRARAALLVARSQVAAEGEAVIRQANELGAAVLGESLPPLSAAAVARRIERKLG